MRWMAERFGLPAGVGRPDDERRRGVQLDRPQGGPRRARPGRRPRATASTAWGSSCMPPRRPTRRSPRRPTCWAWGSGRCARSRPTSGYRMRADELARAVADDLAAGPAPVLRRRDGRHHRHRRRRPAAGGRRHLRASTACGCTSTRPTAGRPCSRRSCARCSPASSAPTRSRSTRTSGSTRPSRARACSPATRARSGQLLDRRRLRARRRRAVGPRHEHRRARAAVVARVHRAQGVDVARGARHRCLRPPHRPRRRARPLPRRRVSRAPRPGADVPGHALDRVLPLRARPAGSTTRRSTP